MARKDENGKKKAKRAKSQSKKARKRAPLSPVAYRQLHALSKEARMQILATLAERVASPKELADQLGEGLSRVSYHVSVLRECELIELVGKEPRRGAVEHFYRAAIPTLPASTPVDELPPLGFLRLDEASAPVILAALPLEDGAGGRRARAGRGGR